MRAADRYTIDAFGLPGFTLMETAGRAAVGQMMHHFGPLEGQVVWVLVGKGNNGGDGLVVARVLQALGVRVRVVSLAVEDASTSDTRHNLMLLRRLIELDATFVTVEPYEDLEALQNGPFPDLIVDALLGTGLKKPLRAPVADLVDWLNEQSVPVVSLDVPTGIDSDTGRVQGRAVKAELTVTMGAYKVGLLMNAGPRHAGTVKVVDIGIPDAVLHRMVREAGCAWQVDDAEVRSWLPARDETAHKYNVGMVLAIVGSARFTGAAVLATRAAARIGAGYVVCATPRRAQPILAAHLTEIPVHGISETEQGTLAEGVEVDLEAWLGKARALLVGCGIGQHPETARTLRAVVAESTQPGVLDADGLYALHGHVSVLAETRHPWILTPHWGEFKRLVGTGVELDPEDRVQLAGYYARQWRCVLVLKGLPSVVGWPDGRVFINATGNPALATAGTGDVLAGLCAGLLAQGVAPERAALVALHLGGAVADRYAAQHDPRTLLASDLIEGLPTLLHDAFRT